MPYLSGTVIPANVVGQDESHLCSVEDAAELGVSVHRDIVEPFHELREQAAASGFDVAILSGFRNFDRQLSIWNRKAAGELPVLDSDARPLEITRLSDVELAFAILRWSALPGASRHHWGTDLDVYDAAARPVGYEIELLPSEYDGEGMFSPISQWLDERIASGTSLGFFRPYDQDRGGIAPERWHLSYAPCARRFEQALTAELLRGTIQSADMRLKDVVLTNLEEIVRRFVRNTNPGAP
ncbi:MAG TPA: M15 family metallopeptidase [Gemmatimonadaceae bacterium]